MSVRVFYFRHRSQEGDRFEVKTIKRPGRRRRITTRRKITKKKKTDLTVILDDKMKKERVENMEEHE